MIRIYYSFLPEFKLDPYKVVVYIPETKYCIGLNLGMLLRIKPEAVSYSWFKPEEYPEVPFFTVNSLEELPTQYPELFI